MSAIRAPLVLADGSRVALLGGELVANRLRARPSLRLILPTGRTALGLYAVLRAHAVDGSLRPGRATLFQLDEHLGLGPQDEGSHAAYVRRELDGIRFGACNLLDGASADPAAECARHQALLDEAPIDLAVLGLGRDGHVAFDEPGSPAGGVRRVRLREAARAGAAAGVGGLERVPREALTAGLRTLLAARELLLLIAGEEKAQALRALLEGPAGEQLPASLLREHPRLTIVCDAAAARLLRPSPGAGSGRALVVLGHREPPHSAEHRISDESLERLRRAEREALRRPPRVVVFTGFTRSRRGLTEAEQLQDGWRLEQVPTLLEVAGRNTAENASRSLPLLRAIGDVRRVTVVTSGWHVRTPYFFAPYRALGLELSFAPAFHGPWLRPLAHELSAARSMRAQRRAAMRAMRLPPEPAATEDRLP